MQSISVANLAQIFRRASRIPALAARGRELNSNDLREYLRRQGVHAKQVFGDLYSDEPPKAALTYEWTLSLNEVLDFLNAPQIRECNRNHPGGEQIPADMRELTIWMDIFFVDQNSSDMPGQMVMSEGKYSGTLLHLVLGTATVGTRAWCVHEVGVRCRAGKRCHLVKSVYHEEDPRFDMLAFVSQTDGLFFDSMRATVPGDLAMIRRRILETYGTPDRFDAAVFRMFKAAAW